MSVLIFVIVVWVVISLLRKLPNATSRAEMELHKRQHSDHRIETYETPRGATIYHCWGLRGEPACGERWKIKS